MSAGLQILLITLGMLVFGSVGVLMAWASGYQDDEVRDFLPRWLWWVALASDHKPKDRWGGP